MPTTRFSGAGSGAPVQMARPATARTSASPTNASTKRSRAGRRATARGAASRMSCSTIGWSSTFTIPSPGDRPRPEDTATGGLDVGHLAMRCLTTFRSGTGGRWVLRRRDTDATARTSRRTMHTKMNTRLLRLALAGAAALAAIAPASASAASGGLLGGTLKAVAGAVGQSTTACDAGAVTAKTFAPWLDQSNYKPAPGGDFEAGSPGWTLTGGAKIVDGNASQQVGGAGDDSSLQLAPGASATSPASCVGLAEPTIRMFATGPVTGLVLVQAVYNGVGLP